MPACPISAVFTRQINQNVSMIMRPPSLCAIHSFKVNIKINSHMRVKISLVDLFLFDLDPDPFREMMDPN